MSNEIATLLWLVIGGFIGIAAVPLVDELMYSLRRRREARDGLKRWYEERPTSPPDEYFDLYPHQRTWAAWPFKPKS